eukprot:145400-Pelagomonas_calceolata.AAC.4
MKTKFTSCLAPRLCLLSRNRVCCFSAAAAVAHAQKRGQHDMKYIYGIQVSNTKYSQGAAKSMALAGNSEGGGMMSMNSGPSREVRNELDPSTWAWIVPSQTRLKDAGADNVLHVRRFACRGWLVSSPGLSWGKI